MVRTAPQLVALAMSFAVATTSGDAVPGNIEKLLSSSTVPLTRPTSISGPFPGPLPTFTAGGFAFASARNGGAPSAAMINGDVDTDNAYPNVGAMIVMVREGNPFGLPPGTILGGLSGVLIHNQTFLTAGHGTARADAEGGNPPFIRVVVTFLPDALDPSGWIDVSNEPGSQVTHPSFPRPCYPPPGFCEYEKEGAFGHGAEVWPDVSDVGIVFLSAPVQGIAHAKLGNKQLSDPNIMGTRMLQVGYGITDGSVSRENALSVWDGLRRFGTATLGAVPGYGINDQWTNFNRDPSGTCHMDSGSPTFLECNGGCGGTRLVALAADGGPTCDTVDYRARVDSHHVREWIKSTIDARFGAGAASASLGRN
jgi:hypothetical protein